MIFIITEKYSVAADFAKALKAFRKDGYFENDDYAITYSVGHLLKLFDAGDYDPKLKEWSLTDLPIIPEMFKHKPIKDTQEQLEKIKALISSRQFDEIIIATDAGREGELIGRLILRYCGFNDYGRVKRFWSSESLTPGVIQKGLEECRPAKLFDQLYFKGYYRQVCDWLFGINFTRYFTCSLGNLFSVGRVQTALLFMIAYRDFEICNFKREPYFRLMALFRKEETLFKAVFKEGDRERFSDKAMLLPILEEVKNEKTALVSSVKSERKRKAPPKLLNLTALQSEANKLFGYSAKNTLDIAQRLYESYKCLSYPRTPSKVLGESNIDLVREKVSLLSKRYLRYFEGIDESMISIKNKRVFNNKELEDHHALIPLDILPENCSEEEKNIYGIVFKSFAAAFYPHLEYTKTDYILTIKNRDFHLSGKVIIDPGWQAVLKPDDGVKEETLPELVQGEKVSIESVGIDEQKTKPPSHYTEASLLSAMENAGRKTKESDEFKKFGIGRPSTRAVIIETLIKRKYVMRNKKNLTAAEKGLYLVKVLKTLKLSSFMQIKETARWERLLEESPGNFFVETGSFVRRIIGKLKSVSLKGFKESEIELGKCPLCGSVLKVNSKSYFCSGWKRGCKFSIWKNTRGKNITPGHIQKLLQGESLRLTFKTKAKRSYKQFLFLDKEGKLTFSKERPKETSG